MTTAHDRHRESLSTVNTWNTKHRTGQAVLFLPWAGADSIRTRTRSAAFVGLQGDPLVMVEGVTGAVHLSYVEAVE